MGENFDRFVDVYSLGCVLYECLTGRVPFERERDAQVLHAHIQDPPPKVTENRAGMPADLDEVIARALAKEPDQRYENATELIEAARRALGIDARAAGSAAGAPGGGAGSALVLEVTEGAAAGTALAVEGTLEIGRGGQGPGQLGGDQELSRRHARVSVAATGELVIEDLGSTNGTFVNRQRISTSRVIAPGDEIGVGTTRLIVRKAAEISEEAISSGADERPEDAPEGPQPSTEAPAPAPPGAGAQDPSTEVVTAGEDEAPLSLSLEIDPPPAELVIRLDSGPAVRALRDGDGWRVEPD
jgi:pSer/pThr/pTyr-binding forkhead associated (FHA) protein